MKVAIFTDTYEPQVNGVAKTLKRWTDFLEKQDVTYRLFAPDTSDQQDYSESIRRFFSLPFWLYPECRLALFKVSEIKNELEAFQPDLIHIVTPFTIGLAGLYYGKKMNIPIVGSYHTHFDQYLDYYKLSFLSPFFWKYMRWFHQSFRKTFVPSIQTKKELEQQGFPNIALWKRGVDSEQFQPVVTNSMKNDIFPFSAPYLLTYVGRLAPEKGLDILMEVSRRIPPHLNEHIHWLLVGNGPMYGQLRKQAPANMTFTGYISGTVLSQIYARSTLFIFPSKTETFGNVVLEALASGTPAIVSKAGGVQEIVDNEKTGILCEPDHPQAFSEAVIHLLSNPVKLTNMSKNARQEALGRSWEEVFKKLLLDYESVLGNETITTNQ
ncbi:Glycosyltransferase involved in cell wall bisynthesis [Halobacillus dabanensis]|uniref:Glycosyltransferase involved in cell wall bisynthesis n=1 Tax=Halobacillus dabanensis TaxID=240302 RepID=A0A1I3W533_HALDA|nr:glycosyltransferase family 1 protein [Halobacillus dabanensis]SFK02550.1 Glycosyltransferase involved in cell wall bisynthesis [Halobacillus dabanensis]